MSKRISITDFTRSKNQLALTYFADDIKFTASHWYPDIDFFELEEKYGYPFMEKIYFHITIFNFSQLINLRPETVDLGPFSKYHTADFEMLWNSIFRGEWSQWRYLNDLPDYKGPKFISSQTDSSIPPISIEANGVEVLNLVGGGKDSLVSMKLFEKAKIPFSTFARSQSVMGRAKVQHELIETSIKGCSFKQHHKYYVYDDFLDSPMADLYPEYKEGFDFPETVMCIFSVFPLMLKYGYKHVSLGNERSAEVGNLVWDKTGEEINHAWAKTFNAEKLYNGYINKHLIANFSSFSILRPIYDVLIFGLLSENESLIENIFSCNIEKPWCYKCPKCAYIWLCYMAYLPTNLVNLIFQNRNLFDFEENQKWYGQLLGLDKHNSFECVGQIPESQLAFELCSKKGISGKAMDMYRKNIKNIDFKKIANKYLDVATKTHQIPDKFSKKIFDIFHKSSDRTKIKILQILR